MIRVLVCRCAQANRLSSEMVKAALDMGKTEGVSFTAIDDLCGLAARNPEWLRTFTEFHDVRIVACHPRTVRAILDSVQAQTDGPKLIDLSQFDSDALKQVTGKLSHTDAGPSPQQEQSPLPVPEAAPACIPEEWVPWYPLIDRQRCTNCGQCAAFCLFDVYRRDADGTVRVENPQNCKNNCPACARICPQAAIIFPKFSGGGTIAGEPVEDEIAENDRIRVDMKKILGEDPYAVLQLRNKRRLLLKEQQEQDRKIADEERARYRNNDNRSVSSSEEATDSAIGGLSTDTENPAT